MTLCITCFICLVEFCPSVVFFLFLPPSDLSIGIWKHCGIAFSKNKDMKQTGRALGPFVPLLEKTSVGSVFIVQTLEEVILVWWKSLSTTELAGMQQHMLTRTDLIPRDLETLDKKHTSITNPHSHHSPHQKLRVVTPTTHPAPVSMVGRQRTPGKTPVQVAEVKSLRLLVLFGNIWEKLWGEHGVQWVTTPQGQVVTPSATGDESPKVILSKCLKLGSACPACRIWMEPRVKFYIQRLRLFGLYAFITCETSEAITV